MNVDEIIEILENTPICEFCGIKLNEDNYCSSSCHATALTCNSDWCTTKHLNKLLKMMMKKPED